MDEPDDSVTQFLNDLQSIKAQQSNVSVPRDDVPTIDTLEQFVLKNSSEVINSSINTLKNMESVVNTIQGAEEIAAYSELVNASTNAIKTLYKILIQKKIGRAHV